MITEKEITEVLKNELQSLPYVYAFWIEGSFAMGYADEYLLHISKHMPQAVVNRLGNFLQVTTLDEMEIAMKESNPHRNLKRILFQRALQKLA